MQIPASAPNMTGFDAERLIQKHQTGVWRYLRSLGCEPALADDLTQETFLAVLKATFQDQNDVATATYLRRTARNQWVSYHRRSGRMLVMSDLEQLDSTWTRWAGDDQGEALLDALRACLTALSDRARFALELRYREKRTRGEIAAKLGMSEDGAKNVLQRAKQKLRECIERKRT